MDLTLLDHDLLTLSPFPLWWEGIRQEGELQDSSRDMLSAAKLKAAREHLGLVGAAVFSALL